jgi:alkylation response protein AidB-like acyl-CoA dehydrogenase
MPEDQPVESPEEFRTRVAAWYAANATPRQETDPWAVNLQTDPAEAAKHFETSRQWQAKLADAGLMGLAWPAEYGGGGGPGWMTRIEREISRDYEEYTGFAGATTAMLGPALLRHASEEQKQTFLPALLSARLTFCQLFSEPGAGSDLASLGTRAVRDGDEFVLNGQKVWNSAAQFCDWAFVLVRTDPDAPKHRGITFLLLDMKSPGVEVRPLVQINRATHFNEVFLTDVRVPVANVIGEINEGWSVARTVLANEAAFIGGGPKAPASDNLRSLARESGADQHPVLRQSLADLITRERVVGWMGEQIQAAIRRGEMPPMDPGLIKLMTADIRARSGTLAMELRGAAGLAGDEPETFWAQSELVGRFAISIGGGTNEVLRNNLGERALGLPREPGFSKDQPWKDIPR